MTHEFLHRHPRLERKLKVPKNHVIVNLEEWRIAQQITRWSVQLGGDHFLQECTPINTWANKNLNAQISRIGPAARKLITKVKDLESCQDGTCTVRDCGCNQNKS